MTRILVITNMYPPHHFGGYELICADVVKRWREQGHRVDVLTSSLRLEGVPEGADDRVLRELEFYWRDHRITHPSWRERLSMERHNQRALATAIDALDPDVVSLWHMGAMSMSLLTTLSERRLPMVLVLGDAWPVYGPDVDPWSAFFSRHPILARGARRLIGIPTALADIGRDAVFCFVSDWLRGVVSSESRWDPQISTVVHHGINPDDFRLPAEPERPWRWRLACVGRLDERKGVHVAVEALARLPQESTLDVLGRGDPAYLDRLRSLVSDLGLEDRVRFRVAPRSALRDVYRDTDALLFPILWNEPFGLVPLEAMASGTPVVATATGGSAEFLVDEANCLVVPRGDAEALATAVRRLADDHALRDRIIHAGQATAEMFDVDEVARRLEEWHLAAADRFQHGRPTASPATHDELRARGVIMGA